jgi:hypothetical protein
MNNRPVQTAVLACMAAAFLAAADPPWKSKPPAQWSEDDARVVLTASPWAREIKAGVARRLSEDELREGGQMGQPRGVGYDGVDPKGSGPKLGPNILTGGNTASVRSTVQAINLRLRWESALPVRLAELKAREMEPPSSEGDGYRIAIYGIPGDGLKGDPKKLGDPLKNEAVLRSGRKTVKPLRVEVFQRGDGWVVVYLFPLSVEITEKDVRAELEARIGRIVVNQSFVLADMVFQGKLEL